MYALKRDKSELRRIVFPIPFNFGSEEENGYISTLHILLAISIALFLFSSCWKGFKLLSFSSNCLK